MGRRKKELAEFHRERIMESAEKLFEKNGIERTTMDEIARDAEYSKATLYVYFQNKEELVNAIVLNSMKMLHNRIQLGIAAGGDLFGKYEAICNELAQYQAEFPLYFEMVLGEISVDIEKPDASPVLKEIFCVGEQINLEIAAFLKQGMEQGDIRADLDLLPTGFVLWASLSGIIRLAGQKQNYLQKAMGISREEFLKYGFDSVLRSILTEGANHA